MMRETQLLLIGRKHFSIQKRQRKKKTKKKGFFMRGKKKTSIKKSRGCRYTDTCCGEFEEAPPPPHPTPPHTPHPAPPSIRKLTALIRAKNRLYREKQRDREGGGGKDGWVGGWVGGGGERERERDARAHTQRERERERERGRIERKGKNATNYNWKMLISLFFYKKSL